MELVGKKKATQNALHMKTNKKGKLYEYKKYKSLFLMFLPVLIYFAVFHYGPMYGILIAFKDFYPVKGVMASPWVGFKHFEQLFTGMYFLPVLKNTLLISFYKLIFGFPAPILLCILLNEVKNSIFKKGVQTISYLPHFISWVVLSGIVIEVLSPSRGVVNYVIQALGGNPIFFVGEESWFRAVLVGSSIWREIGWQSIVYLAAVSGIDPELYDVAELDGAGRLRKIWSVTLPSIAPIVTIMFIFAAGNIINDDFDQVFNLLNAKVMSVGDVISTYTYRVGLQSMNFSYATAVGLFKNVVALILVTSANYISRKFSEASLW